MTSPATDISMPEGSAQWTGIVRRNTVAEEAVVLTKPSAAV